MNGPWRHLVAFTGLDRFFWLALDVKHKLAFQHVARFRTGMCMTANIYVRHDLSHSDNGLVVGARDIELLQRRTLDGRTLLCRRGSCCWAVAIFSGANTATTAKINIFRTSLSSGIDDATILELKCCVDGSLGPFPAEGYGATMACPGAWGRRRWL